MNRLLSVSILVVVSCFGFGCSKSETRTLPEARRGFKTRIVREEERSSVEAPPADRFRLVSYNSPVGNLPAYRTTPRKDGKKRPAILWVTGGDSNSVGSIWEPADPENDQSATGYPRAGVVTMFAVLRGGNETKMLPGAWASAPKESFLGEVDDILAAADWLAKQPDVDPKRLFLGGHSTGGTLALLVAASSNRFRAVFAFGPVSDVSYYGGKYLTCEETAEEIYLRSPIHWLHGIQTPTFVLEGEEGNADSVREMEASTKNPNVHFRILPGLSHFTILSPINEKIAETIMADRGTGAFRF